jgi:energy-coupling factor transporter transmembrane protein EcfT
MRKALATVAVVLGLGLVVIPFALSLFDRAAAGQRVTNRFRETMSVQGLHQLSTNFGTMGALVDQFVNRTSPQLARELGMSAGEYNAFVARRFPAVAAGVKGIPPLVTFVTPVAAQLEALHPQFASVDSLPFLGLALTTIPWILLALGAALIGLGVVVWRTGGRGPLRCVVVLGVAMLIAPLALSYPRKASDAKKVAAIGRVALSPQAAAGAQAANRLIDNMVTQVKAQMLPAVAQRLHLSTAALETTIAADYPAVAKGLAAWPSIKPGAVALVRLQVASVNDAAEMNGLDFTPLPWYIIGPGIALMLTGAVALTVRSRPEAAWNGVPRLGTTRVRSS